MGPYDTSFTEGLGVMSSSQITHHEPGVYLGLREDSYLADPALGYSSLGALRQPLEFWFNSPINTVFPKPPKDQKYFERGTACHVLFLEPPGTYDRTYGIVPTRMTNPNAIDTIPELIAACKKHGLATNYAVKADLVDRLSRGAPKVEILEVERQKFFASGKRPISADDHMRIQLSFRMAMRTREELGAGEDDLTLADAFTGGLSEVSCFWEDEAGIRQRARFDKLKPNVTIDLKTISDWKPSDFKTSLLKEIRIRNYLGQVVHYNEARRQLRKFVAADRVFGGTKAQRTLLKRIAKQETWAWTFVFCKMTGFPAVRAIVFTPENMGLVEEGPDFMQQFVRAADERRDALTQYQFFKELYGDEPGSIWFDNEIVYQPTETDWGVSSVWNGEN